MRTDLLVNDFVYSAKRRGVIVVYERASRRTFIHVRDMARAFLFGLEHLAGMAGEVPYNAGAERLNLTKDEIAHLILARHPFFACLRSCRDRRGPAGLQVSYAKLQGLGYDATVEIEQGIDELLRDVDLLPPP